MVQLLLVLLLVWHTQVYVSPDTTEIRWSFTTDFQEDRKVFSLLQSVF